MRILHTSDWHIGQKIYEQSRTDEHSRFLDWLLDIIIQRDVDVLLIAGDVFDSSVPTAEATNLYYRFLFDLYQKTRAHAVIIAGNHDSAVRLTAPAKFLQMARIHVVGGILESPRECVVSLDVNGKKISIAAVPYLNESDILSHVSLEGEMERSLRYREALRKIYKDCMSAMPPEHVRILMGHYFIQNSTASGSERLVQIGDTQPLRKDDLPHDVDYIALGHLHKKQWITGSSPAGYSGSPIPMNFKEAIYDKTLFLLDVNGNCEVEEIKVPKFRDLVHIEGDLHDIMDKANFGNWKDMYIEIKVHLDRPQIGVGDRIRQVFANRGGKVLVVESILPVSADRESISAEEIKSKSPDEIFQDFYKDRFGETRSEEFDELLSTFRELLDLSAAEEGES